MLRLIVAAGAYATLVGLPSSTHAAEFAATGAPTTSAGPVATTAPVNASCLVKNCRKCDPVLRDECLECEPPKLRFQGQCHDSCSKGYFPIRNKTDLPPDYPRCERDCHSLVVSGIPSGPEPWPRASSEEYNSRYGSLIPVNSSTSEAPTYADVSKGAYLILNEEKQWKFVGLPAVCANGTQQCSALNKLAIGGYTVGPTLERPQLCDAMSSCTWKFWQCNCSSLQRPCRCERDQWAEVPIASIGITCGDSPGPVVIFPSPAPTSKPPPDHPSPSPKPDPPGHNNFLWPLAIAATILVIGLVVSFTVIARKRSGQGRPKSHSATLHEVAAGQFDHERDDSQSSLSNTFFDHGDLGESLLSRASSEAGSSMVFEPGDDNATNANEAAHQRRYQAQKQQMGLDVKPEWKIPFERLSIDPRAKIGVGGFGVVYRGKFDGIDVAVKKLERSELTSQITREAAVLASLRHPHVVQLYGLSQDDYCIYIVMELCRMSLSALMRRDGVPPSRQMRLRIALQISETMSFLHMRGVIHRDLKPENVLLHGNAYDVKICDFGLSKIIRDNSSLGGHSRSNITLEIGTPAYMAPEMFVTDEVAGPVQSKSVDGRKVDVYSFGIMLYYLYTMQVGLLVFYCRLPLSFFVLDLCSRLQIGPVQRSQHVPDRVSSENEEVSAPASRSHQ